MLKGHYKVTKLNQERIFAMKSYGVTNENIAKIIGISSDTLVRHHKEELEVAAEKANAMVAKSLFDKAVLKGDITAIIFWLKTRARWKTADNETLLESNDQIKEEIRALRAQLDAKNKKDY